MKSQDSFPILATSSRALEYTRVLKHGDTFAVFDRHGDIQPGGIGEQGIYHQGTRFLSRCVLLYEDHRPMFLSSSVKEDNTALVVDLTNPDSSEGGQVVLLHDSIHIARTTLLWDSACYMSLCVRNYTLAPVDVNLALVVASDYADVFEVRGSRRQRKGSLLETRIDGRSIVLGYEGLDRVVRRTRIEFSPVCTYVAPTYMRFGDLIPPQEERTYYVTVSCEVESAHSPVLFGQALDSITEGLRSSQAGDASIYTSNEQFNQMMNRSSADLHMMITRTPCGPYPYAGVPWFSTPFGRDGIITAFEYLWVNAELARGVLGFLASTQALEVIPEQDAEPGKIVHELRRGEMAALGEIPFGRYYGTVDATPLFVMLAGAYYRRTGDLEFIRSIWPNVELALRWISEFGDVDGDGFVEYQRVSSKGLIAQGWKDSFDAVFHADGTLAAPPVAVCEVQGYCYAGWLAAAELAAALGLTEKASELRHSAGELQQRFEAAFWSEEMSSYALALDGAKRPCLVRASNAGHCLFSGIADPQHARRTAETLVNPESFSGWGIRTIAAGQARYNPMSYHNGSVWPHDNALIAAGMARYGLNDAALRVMTALFEASLFMDLSRVPELFCGFPRRPGEGPTLYPVACAPQSWAAASGFMFVQACLGLEIDAPRRQIRLMHPVLPEWIEKVLILNLRVGNAAVDLTLDRIPGDVGIVLSRREGDISVVIVK